MKVSLVQLYKAKCTACGTERDAQIGGIAGCSVIDRCAKCLNWEIEFLEKKPHRSIPLLQDYDFSVVRTREGEKIYMIQEREFTQQERDELISLTTNAFTKINNRVEA